MSKKRILWVSDLGIPTGFGRVSHSIIKFIKDDYDITGFGINYKGVPHKVGIDIYPASSSMRDPMGFNKIAGMIKSDKYDMIYMLQDIWVVNQYLIKIKEEIDEEDIPPIVVYFPVDAEDHDPAWYSNFDIVTKAVAYNKFGKIVAEKAAEDFNFEIIPHGVDTDIFKQVFDTRLEAKKLIFAKNTDRKIPDFVILNMNRNQPRKRLDLTMRGFAEFAKGKDDVALYMHCGVVDSSIDVARLAKILDIEDKLLLTNLNPGPQQVSDEHLNLIYNACDCGTNSSLGEGWGLGAIEHAATGAYQIVPDSSACKELFEGVGTLIPIVTDYTLDGIMTVGKLVSKEGVANAMEEAYQKRKEADYGKAGQEKFLSEKYQWKTIAKQWAELFNEVMK